jgi:hypothetical protein
VTELAPRASRLPRRAVALCAAVALLSSALLAAGAHEHLSPLRSEVICTSDHSGPPPAAAEGVRRAERPHRHHCASCQHAAKHTAQSPARAALDARCTGSEKPFDPSRPFERAPRRAAASPRGPPIS